MVGVSVLRSCQRRRENMEELEMKRLTKSKRELLRKAIQREKRKRAEADSTKR
ncbi:hypothetical protein LCGC14_1209700 [marine sediment metagenome]|uniref:Uncharacterized protein n=1 Tax=marine sediment metagenome TaxID=412755 RepID=A0A0F9NWS4_9ZZZZ